MGSKKYTQLGARISKLCGTQDRIAEALELHRGQISRKLTGVTPITVGELQTLAYHFKIPITAFFEQPDMDPEVFRECYRMFCYDPLALDRIIEAFNKRHKNLKELGEVAEHICKEEREDAVRSS